MKSKIISIWFVLMLLLSLIPITNVNVTAAWWDADWDFCQTLSIDNSFIDTTLDNFPVLVVINSSTATNCMANGEDIRFTNEGNTTEFAYEIEEWNAAGDSFVWVNVTQVLSAAVTKFNIYYGNSSATDGQNPEGVWNNSYVLVWHKNDSTVSRVTDSTSNHASGDKKLGNQPNEITGIVGNCQDYDGSDDYINASHPANLDNTGKITVEAYLNLDNIPSGPTYDIIERKDRGYSFYVADSGQLQFYYWNVGGTRKTRTSSFDSPITTGVWQYVVARYDNANTSLSFILNTTKNNGIETDASEAQDVNNHMYVGGRSDDTGYTIDGRIDEFRISDVERNNSWLRASYNTMVNYSTFITWGSVDTVGLFPDSPTNLVATTQSTTSPSVGIINLTWTKGTNTTHTVIRRNGTYPTSPTEGTFVYNNTGDGVTVTGLDPYTVYYFSAWGYNSTRGNWSVDYATAVNNTGPLNPTVVNATSGTGFLNITWTVGLYSNFSTLLHNATAYPDAPNDPDSNLLYNGSGKTTPSITPNRFFNDTTYASGYYRLYSWSNYTDLFSSGVNVAYGSLTIAVFDENTSEAIPSWDVFITNEDGSETYESTGNSNNVVLDISLLPTGANTAVKINATWYDFRIYYMDIYVNNIYTLNAHLSPENVSELYEITVIGPLGEFTSPPIEDAQLIFARYINATVGYENASILYTDANGKCSVYLVPASWGGDYKVTISRDGYETKIVDLFQTCT